MNEVDARLTVGCNCAAFDANLGVRMRPYRLQSPLLSR